MATLPRSSALLGTLWVFSLCTVCLAEPSPVGIWDVTGRDEADTNWNAVLFLEPADVNEYPPTKLKGYFDWKGSNKTGGREYVVLATYNYESRSLVLQGSDLEDADPNICTAIYKATMSNEADKLTNGTWSGPKAIPGIWEAKRSDKFRVEK